MGLNISNINNWIRGLKKDVILESDKRISGYAETFRGELVKTARKHAVTGELARNLYKVKRGDNRYEVNGGSRAHYTDKSYHPMFFLVKDDGVEAFVKAMDKTKKVIAKNNKK